MVFRRISNDIKTRALWLLANDYTSDEVCNILGVSERSLRRWFRNQINFGSVTPPPSYARGRRRILTVDATHDILALLDEAPDLFLDEIQDWLAIAHDVAISRTALFENIRDIGITYKMLRKAAAERDEEARAAWKAMMQAHYTASQVIVVDESSKDDRTLFRSYGRSPAGHSAIIPANFVRGQRYSLLAAMDVDGYIGARVVEGSVDGEEFLHFIFTDILPKMNPFPQDRSVLILDNCAIHKSSILRELVEANGSVLLFLPPYSPDFNPIEESFSCVKAWIRRHWRRIQQDPNPEVALLNATGAVTAEKARGWFRHSGYLF